MSKPALLLLHGAIGTSKQFDPLLPLLSDRFSLHAIDFPGHGSGPPAEKFSIPLFASFVLDYMDRHAIPEAPAFGYSMGGYVALYLAAHHPGRLNKIFTLATKFAWTPEVAEKETVQLDGGKISEKIPAFAEALQRAQAPQDWKAVLTKTASMLKDLGARPPLGPSEWKRISIPVRIGIGELDKMVSLEESKSAVAHIPGAELLVVPATPHPFEKVDRTVLAGYIREYLG